MTLEEATTADIENFMIHLISTHSATTASVRFKSLQQFYSWLTAEEWISPQPDDRATRPQARPRNRCRCLSDDELRAPDRWHARARSSPTAETRP